MVHNSLTPLEA